ncbi:hypothetical protein PM082_006227 [Marasmius tenuissimus]|nr:hypothetical protein PM082_006227 [Marasmius tenuissimus]
MFQTARSEDLYKRPAEVTVDLDEWQSVWDDLDAYRYFHVLRFFESLEGFYRGELDLTGRHMLRYEELMCTYERLCTDLDEVRKTVVEEEYETEERHGRFTRQVGRVVTNHEMWRNCRLKWKLPRAVDFDSLEVRIGRLARVKQKSDGLPKIQNLCLIDLPPELVLHVFCLAEVQQGRLLASTCKYMNNIGSSPHLYETRTVTLHFAEIEQMQMLRENPEVLNSVAHQTSRELIDHSTFLTSRPELTQHIRTIDIIDRWRAQTIGIPSFRSYLSDSAFYDPINGSLTSLLRSCTGLTRLTVSHLAITTDWLRALSQLQNLHTVRLRYACIESPSVEDDILDGFIPSSPHVLNVRWDEFPGLANDLPARELAGRGLWYTLLLFPGIATFSHQLFGGNTAVWLPVFEIQEWCDMFCRNLRKLILGLILDDVPALIEWINQSQFRTASSCSLTHLNLFTDRPLPDDLAILLLQFLNSAPLQVLILQGVKEGSLTLLERIIQLFPDLQALTLTRKAQQFLRFTTAVAPWPHQTGDYASQFQSFRRLKYFGWNIYIPEFDYTSASMLGLEAGSAIEGGEVKRSDTSRLSWDDHMYPDDDEFYQDDAPILRPFACYCPTLEYVVLEGRSRDMYYVSRGTNGEVKLSDMHDPQLGVKPYPSREWHPGPPFSSWEPVLLVGESD